MKYMEYLNNFDVNKQLFKCKMSEFSDTIRLVLSKISDIDIDVDHRYLFSRFDNLTECIICLKCMNLIYRFVICKKCVNTCSFYLTKSIIVRQCLHFDKYVTILT